MIHYFDQIVVNRVDMAETGGINAVSENARSELCVFVPKLEVGFFRKTFMQNSLHVQELSIHDKKGLHDFNAGFSEKACIVKERGTLIFRTCDVGLIRSIIESYQLAEVSDGCLRSFANKSMAQAKDSLCHMIL